MSSSLESEDLDDVPLVRMEDVQPSRDRSYEVIGVHDDDIIETCVIEDIEYDNECIIKNDDDSNIGSMVSVRTEEDNDDHEIIVPEILDEPCVEYVYPQYTKSTPHSWPTLEILPGGVIKKPDKIEDHSIFSTEDTDKSELMYACAKCSQKFKYLFCLVKHVKWHEEEAKLKDNPVPRLKREYNRYPYAQPRPNKRKVIICMKTHKKKTPKKAKSK